MAVLLLLKDEHNNTVIILRGGVFLKAVIMAGGEGSRLRPITCTMPKPMVPLLNKPVIDYCVELLKRHGIEDISVTLHYLPNAIKDHLGEGKDKNVQISYSLEESPLGTAGSVKMALGDCRDSVLVISGDAITDIDLSKAIARHKSVGAAATIILKQVALPLEYGVAIMDDQGHITRFLEKPQLSEVFSDLANTGIYILEPEVINLIPDGVQYDFSKDLFPKLFEKGITVHGYVAEGYWCDIGDIRQYMQAQRDMLDGKCTFETIAHRNDGVFIEPKAGISPNTIINGPCYISSNAEIGENTCIGAYSVICSGVKISRDCSIKRSILMDGARLRNNIELRGAVVCQNAHISEGSSIFENAVIGNKTYVGHNCTISPGVLIWPQKQVEDGVRCEENIVWGQSKQLQFTDCGINGYSDGNLSPEAVVRLSSAYGKMLGPLSGAAVATDGSIAAVMLKQAAISGLMSQGVDVYDLSSSAYSAMGFAVRRMGINGGIYIDGEPMRDHRARIRVCDNQGVLIDAGKRRKLNFLCEQGEILPLTEAEIGLVRNLNGMNDVYEAELWSQMAHDKIKENPPRVLLNAPKKAADIISTLLIKCGCTVMTSDSENPQSIYELMSVHRADLWIYIDNADNLNLLLPESDMARQDELNAAFALNRIEQDGATSFIMPFSMPVPYIELLREKGAAVVLAHDASERRKRSHLKDNKPMNEFFEPEAAAIKACELWSQGRLKSLLDALPKAYTKETSIGCSWKDVGRVLRSLVDTEHGASIETVDGVKIRSDTGWVIVKPNDEFAACRLICGSYNQEYADELCDIYSSRLKHMVKQGKKQ